MSTHDYIVDNQNGANFRSDLNNALAAIVSNNSSATAPTTTYAFMLWADTANDLLKQRNAADSAWISILTLSTGAPLADYADNALSGNAIDGGTISNFTSTGIDDNATGTKLTISDTTITGVGAFTSTSIDATKLSGNLPAIDGSALTGTGITDVVDDTTPQLGGSLDVNGNSIVSASNGDIEITPNGTGDVVLDGLKYPQADGTAGYVLKTDGAAQLSWVAQTTDTNTTYTSSDFTHNSLSGVTANEHIDWTTDQGATNIDDGNLTGSPTFTTLNATTVDFGNWTVTETAGVLIFASSGTNKAKLDASGNFTVTGDVISNGTV
jgi:hypothetical protein